MADQLIAINVLGRAMDTLSTHYAAGLNKIRADCLTMLREINADKDLNPASRKTLTSAYRLQIAKCDQMLRQLQPT